MSDPSPRRDLEGSPRRVPRDAWLVAIAADVVQWIALPAFLPGPLSGVHAALDVLVAIVLVARIGWHPVLLPAFIAELVPFVDLAPSWTLAVAFVSSRRR